MMSNSSKGNQVVPDKNQAVDSLVLPNGECIVANQEKAWRYPSGLAGSAPAMDSFAEAGDPKRLRQLFAGVINSAWRSAGNKHSDWSHRTISLQRYINNLAAAYQTTHATPSIMTEVARHYRTLGRERLALYCEQVRREEAGHDDLALRDLRALGIDAQVFVAAVQPPNALAVADYGRQLAHSAEPVAVLGYAYALERMALFNTAEYVAAIEAILPKGVRATRCLRVHSAAGTDTRHVDESLEFIAELPVKERRAIAMALYETIVLLSVESDYPGDDVLDGWINEYTHSV